MLEFLAIEAFSSKQDQQFTVFSPSIGSIFQEELSIFLSFCGNSDIKILVLVLNMILAKGNVDYYSMDTQSEPNSLLFDIIKQCC